MPKDTELTRMWLKFYKKFIIFFLNLKLHSNVLYLLVPELLSQEDAMTFILEFRDTEYCLEGSILYHHKH